MQTRTAFLTSLLLAAILSAPAAVAWAPDADVVDLAGPVAAHVDDRDGDGHVEAWGGANTGRLCGCACPEVGGLLVVSAAGQRVSVFGWTVLVVCGDAVLFDADPGAINPTGPVDVSFTPYVWPPVSVADLLA